MVNCRGRTAPVDVERGGQQQATWILRGWRSRRLHAGLQVDQSGRARVMAHRGPALGHGERALDPDPQRERTK